MNRGHIPSPGHRSVAAVLIPLPVVAEILSLISDAGMRGYSGKLQES
jgi:hypothetical protein